MFMDFVRIPSGRFLMGSETGPDDERPLHEIEVAAFECAVFPITQDQYAEFLRATGYETPREWPDRVTAIDLPVTGVSWIDAHAFCRWRTAAGDPMRLPTEAEWEYAARGGLEGAQYSWGDAIPDWVPSRGRGPLPGPWAVTLGQPNGFGIFGIGANIHEWCADWYAADYYAQSPARNPRGPATGRRRASRGGAWRHDVTISRCAQRSRIDPSFRYTDYGFRVVR
ncbi:MAG TPA: SUMF1/EgtB/PvdO family nonheme iron enzyme [Vicinamibacterales bacterium]|nr:SUMF1/EgtB/PvdO family nonheme iron enzyme [Vicinamibacterales bacterium]